MAEPKPPTVHLTDDGERFTLAPDATRRDAFAVGDVVAVSEAGYEARWTLARVTAVRAKEFTTLGLHTVTPRRWIRKTGKEWGAGDGYRYAMVMGYRPTILPGRAKLAKRLSLHDSILGSGSVLAKARLAAVDLSAGAKWSEETRPQESDVAVLTLWDGWKVYRPDAAVELAEPV